MSPKTRREFLAGSVLAGSADAGLRPTKADPISGQALRKQCSVRVYNARSD